MTNLAYSIYAVPLLVAAVLSAVVAAYVWPRRHVQGATQLALIAAVIAVWSLGYGLEIMATDLVGKLWWGKSQYVGITFAPYLWLVFAVAYTRQGQTRPWFRLRWLAILPFITTLLAFTTEWHGLIWSEITIAQQAGFTALGVSYGAWFWGHFAYSYLFLLVGTIVLLRGLWHMQGLYRAQVVALLVAIFAPWVSNLLFFANLSPIPGLDLTPFAFTITVVALAWGIVGYQLGDIAPIARDVLVDGMREGVLVVNGQGRIVDMNPAAARALGLPVGQAIGQWAAELLSPWPHLLEHLYTATEVQDELVVGRGETERRYRVRVSTLVDGQQRPLGRLFTLREALGTAEPGPTPRMVPTAQLLGKQGAGQATAVAAPSGFWEHPLPRTLLNLFIPPPLSAAASQKQDLNILSQLLERAFTAMLRLALLIAAPSLFLSVPRLWDDPNGILLALIFTGGVLIMAAIGFLRHIRFATRSYLFLFIFYLIALAELLNYGYSPEAFIFFLTLSVLAVLLRGLWGGLFITLASTISLYMVGWQISLGTFAPYLIPADNLPPVGAVFFPTVMVFLASGVALIIVVIILTQSVNRAWWQETQAKNLLQQERDLLEQRVAERTQQLSYSEANLRAFIQSTPAIIVQVNEQQEVVFGHVPGLAEEEMGKLILGQSLLNFIHPNDRTAVQEQLATAVQTRQTTQVEFMAYNPVDQAFHPYLTSIAPFLDAEQHISALLICTDITERHETERTLQQTADRLAEAQALGRMSNWELNLTTGQVLWAKEHYTLFGVSPATFTPTPQTFRTCIHPDDLPIIDQSRDDVRLGKAYNLEYRIIRPDDGQVRYMHSWAKRITNDHGELIRLVGVVQDVTERKQIEATLQAYAEELAIARDQALEASKYKSLLLSKVSHELRTPLGGIIGYAELLRDELAGPMAPEQQDFVAYIIESSHHLNGLITDLLDQAQIEQGTLKISPRPMHLPHTAHFLRELLQPLAERQGLAFSLSLAADLPPDIMADEKRIRQIIINLANNAIKFTEQGQVAVRLQRSEAAWWRIEIEDTGPGIPPEAQKRIFDSFWQVNEGQNTLQKGYGLGLSIVQQLVLLMGGIIEVQSEIGRGSTFMVNLPLLPTNPTHLTPA